MADLSTRLATVTSAILAKAGTPVPPVVTPPVTTPPVVTPPVTTPPVVTPPVTNPPTSSTPPSTGPYTALLKDDFTGYKTTADFLARVTPNIGGTGNSSILYTDGRNPTLATLDETITYNGHHTLRYNQAGGTDAGPELWVGLAQPLTHVWFKAAIRFMPGWTTIGTGKTYGDGGVLVGSSNAYKLIGWGYGGNSDGSGRIEITNTTQYQNYWNGKYRTGGNYGGGNTACGNVSTEWSDGVFYTYIVEIDNTQPTAITRFYIGKDSAKPTMRGACTGTSTLGGLVPPISSIMFGMNYNQVRNAGQDQFLTYGEWDIVDGSKYANPFGV